MPVSTRISAYLSQDLSSPSQEICPSIRNPPAKDFPVMRGSKNPCFYGKMELISRMITHAHLFVTISRYSHHLRQAKF